MITALFHLVRWRLRVLAPLMLHAVLTGCETTGNGPRIVHEVDAPDYAELAAAHNERVAMLQQLYSRGVLEVRWRDDTGVQKREPQVDLDLYFMPQRRTAFRASKVGEIYLWLGSDAQQFWVFDMTGEERVLFHAAHDIYGGESGEASMPHPLLIRDLMGLVSLPEREGESPMEYSPERDAWMAVAPASSGRGWIRLYFDRSSSLPKRAEALMRGEQVIFTSEIGRYRRATQDGMSAVRFPWMPTLVDVTAEDVAEGVSRIDVKIALASPTGRVDDQPMDRVFDLDRLKHALRPERVEAR